MVQFQKDVFSLLIHDIKTTFLLLHRMCRQHLTSTSAEANAQSILFTVSSDDDLIVVLQELARLAALQLHCLGAAPAQLQEGTIRIGSLATYGARGHQITGAQVAAGGSVMSDLLQWRPVKMLEVGLADECLIVVGRCKGFPL